MTHSSRRWTITDSCFKDTIVSILTNSIVSLLLIIGKKMCLTPYSILNPPIPLSLFLSPVFTLSSSLLVDIFSNTSIINVQYQNKLSLKENHTTTRTPTVIKPVRAPVERIDKPPHTRAQPAARPVDEGTAW